MQATTARARDGLPGASPVNVPAYRWLLPSRSSMADTAHPLVTHLSSRILSGAAPTRQAHLARAWCCVAAMGPRRHSPRRPDRRCIYGLLLHRNTADQRVAALWTAGRGGALLFS